MRWNTRTGSGSNPSRTGSGSYLGQLHAERRHLDPPEPPQALQRQHGREAGEELDERQEAELVVTDEELEQDVERPGEHAVRHGHGDPQQPAPEHLHGFTWTRAAGGLQLILRRDSPLCAPAPH